MLKQLFRPLEVKEVSTAGAFEGLASVYGNLDLGNDVVAPGAFKEMDLVEGKIRILSQHRGNEPVGLADLTDTHVGLALKGQLELDLPAARIAHTWLTKKLARGLSIGFDILPGGTSFDEKGVRTLTALKLWEVSIVTFPMNPAALVSSAKALGFTTIRELEAWLRDELDFSHSKAVEFTGKCKTLFATGARDEPRNRDGDAAQAEEMKGVVSSIQSHTHSLKELLK